MLDQETRVIVTLCGCQLINLSLLTYIFPFITQYLLSLGVDPHDVGTWAGATESVFTATMLLSTPLWMHLVFRLPHRTTLMTGLGVLACLAAVFGLGKRLWHLMLCRALLGCLQCTGYMCSIIIGGSVSPERRAHAYAWGGASNFAGAALGQAVGGILAMPEGRIPLLGSMKFFKQHPFALPGMAISGIAILGMIAVRLYIPETNPRWRTVAPEEEHINAVEDKAPIRVRHLFKGRPYVHLVAMDIYDDDGLRYSHHKPHTPDKCGLHLTIQATGGVLSPSLGGFGLEVPVLGRVLSLSETFGLLALFFGFPWLFKRLSVRTMTMIIAGCWVIRASSIPVVHAFALNGQEGGFWATLTVTAMAKPLGLMWGPLYQVLLDRLYPDPHERPVALGLQRQTSAFSCSAGSALYGHLFAVSSTYAAGTAGRQIATLVSVSVTVLGFLLATQQSEVAPMSFDVSRSAERLSTPTERTRLLPSEIAIRNGV